jgi:hypothetical protein
LIISFLKIKYTNIPENACPKKCPILQAELWTSSNIKMSWRNEKKIPHRSSNNCEIKNKQPFENMWSKYIKDNFYLYIACLNKEFKLRKICFPNLPHTKKERKTHKDRWQTWKNILENACPKKCSILHAELWTSSNIKMSWRNEKKIPHRSSNNLQIKPPKIKYTYVSILFIYLFYFILFITHLS